MSIPSAVEDLKADAFKDECNKGLQTIIDHVSSHLVLLKSSNPAISTVKKLMLLLRKPLVPLYQAYTNSALRLSSAIFSVIYHEKMSVTGRRIDARLFKSWEGVETSILSGILDFMELSQHNAKDKEAVANIYYPVLIDIFFLLPSSSLVPPVSSSLVSTVYAVLRETVTGHAKNQHELRDPNVLGGKRIGVILSQTKDFLAIETLLDLFALILPSTQRSLAGREKRSQFLRDFFGSVSLQQSVSQELVQIVESVSSTDWEESFLKIIDVLARSDLTFPQPFQLNQLTACGSMIFQSAVSKRIFLDNKSFFTNVEKDDSYDSFQALYSHVESIKYSVPSSIEQVTSFTVFMSSPPIIGESVLSTPLKNHPIDIKFKLKNADMKRFMESLRIRGLGDRISQVQSTKLSLSQPIPLFKDDGQALLEVSADEKIKTVERLIPTTSGFTSPGIEDDCKPSSDLHVSPTTQKGKTAGPASQTTLGRLPPLEAKKERSTMFPPSSSTRKQSTPNAESIFGTSGDELSELSDDDAPPVFLSRRTGILVEDSGISKTAPARKARVLNSKDNDKAAGPAAVKSISSNPDSALQDEMKSEAITGPPASDSSVTSPRRSTVARRSGLLSKKSGLSVSDAGDSNSIWDRPNDPYPTSRSNAIIKSPARKSSRLYAPLVQANDPYEEIPGSKIKSTSISQKALIKQDLVTGENIKSARKPLVKPTMPQNFKGDTKRKRRAAECGPTSAGLIIDQRPSKRIRAIEDHGQPPAAPKQPDVLGSVIDKVTRTTRKYGKKGKTSSPTPQIGLESTKFTFVASLTPIATSAPMDSSRKEKLNLRNKYLTPANQAKDRNSWNKSTDQPVSVKQSSYMSVPTHTPKGPRYGEAPSKIENSEATVQSNLITKNVNQGSTPVIKDGHKTNVPPSGKPMLKTAMAPWEKTGFVVESLSELKAMDSIDFPVQSEVTTSTINKDVIIRRSRDGHTNNQSIPRPVTLFSLPRTQERSTIIDLTNDNPNESATPSLVGSECPVQAVEDYTDVSPIRPQRFKTAPSQEHHSVKFVSSKSSPPPSRPIVHQPLRSNFPVLVKQKGNIDPSISLPTSRKASSKGITARPKQQYIGDHDADDGYDGFNGHIYEDGNIQDIVNVLNEIQEVIVHKISQGFTDVKSEVRSGRDQMIREVIADLNNMRAQNVTHFNSLVDLEEQYSALRRMLVNGFEDICKVSRDASLQLEQTIKDHDRHTLSKKFPTTLFPSPLPSFSIL